MLIWDLSSLTREIARRILNRAAGDMQGHYGDQLTIHEQGEVEWHSGGIFAHKIVTEDYMIEGEDIVVIASTSSAPIIISLPPAEFEHGHMLIIKRLGVRQVTIVPNGTDTIDGAASFTLNVAYKTVGLIGSRSFPGYIIIFDYP
jgi:hypothetical protein